MHLLAEEMQNLKNKRLRGANIWSLILLSSQNRLINGAVTQQTQQTEACFQRFISWDQHSPFTSLSHDSSLKSCCWISNFLLCVSESWLGDKSPGGNSTAEYSLQVCGENVLSESMGWRDRVICFLNPEKAHGRGTLGAKSLLMWENEEGVREVLQWPRCRVSLSAGEKLRIRLRLKHTHDLRNSSHNWLLCQS